jgi:hypothetical protein
MKMKIIFMTHSDAENVNPKGSFRPISEKGIVNTDSYLKLLMIQIL